MSKRTGLWLALAALLCCASCGDDDDAKRARIKATLERQAKHPDVVAAVAVAKREGFEKRWANLYPVSAMSPTMTAVAVLGLNLALPLLLFAYICSRWLGYSLQRRRAEKAGAEAREREAVEEGPTTIHGELVEVDGGGDVALELLIVQSGHTTSGKNKKTIWSEIERKQAVRPFFIELQSGQRVRVEPDDNTRLVDDLTAPKRIGPKQRERRAHLQVGERVYVDGQLARAQSDMVMRPPSGRRMLLSTRPMGDVFHRRLRHQRWWAILALLAICAANYLFHKPYLLGRLTFTKGTAVVIGKKIIKKKKKKGGVYYYYLINVVIAQTGQTFREAMEKHHFNALHRGSRLPVVYNPDYVRYAQVGPAVAEPVEKLFFSLGWIFPLFLVYFVRLGKARLWYESAKLVEKVSGSMSKWVPPEQPSAGGDHSTTV